MTQLLNLPNVPRYTSYPTAPHFSRDDAARAQSLLIQSIDHDRPISVYLHVPFCDRLCWFCGCHTKHTLKYHPVARYVSSLAEEIKSFSSILGFKPELSHLHFGGGSPSMLRLEEAQFLNETLRDGFCFTDKTEISVEIDPNDISQGDLSAMLALGMSRASIGIQDFDESVQKAINRPQSFEDTAALVQELRLAGIKSVNFDALYGLPNQTCETILETAQKIVSLEPDRIAQFGYAHVPHLKKHQRMIDDATLPSDAERMKQANLTRSIFVANKYQEIGIDHFAKPGDSLTIAKENKTMRRNFQGYTTDPCRTLIGFGASAISSCELAITQNTVPTQVYQDLVSNSGATTARGIVLSRDDRIRSMIIETLMCNFEVDFDALATAFGDIDTYRRIALQISQTDGLDCCDYSNSTLKVVANKEAMVRLVAAQFDAYLDTGASTYSKAV